MEPLRTTPMSNFVHERALQTPCLAIEVRQGEHPGQDQLLLKFRPRQYLSTKSHPFLGEVPQFLKL